MKDLFASGRIVDIIVVLVVLEFIALVAYFVRTGRGPEPRPLFCNLLAGVGLLLALRGALVDAGWPWIAGCLLAALAAHLVDLAQRWRH